jgi:shikimate kinase
VKDRRATIALLGLRCSGKSTVGRSLAEELSLPFVDLDLETLRFGRHSGWRAGSVGELLESTGEARFRDLEAATLRRLIEPSPELVLATGGGVVERADNRTWLARTARCVFLSVPFEVLAARLHADAAFRPALVGTDPRTELAELHARREPHYRALAEVTIECGDAPASEIVRRIRAHLETPAAHPPAS